MYKFFCFLLCSFVAVLIAEPVNSSFESSFNAFTGKIVGNKVRLRTQPSMDSPIVRELNKNDLIIVLSEEEDFFVIAPPVDLKGFIFRTFVLDNVIEGNRVNVRLEPNLESPIIAQLNSGDHVNGTISTQNNKWLEISLPSNARFFVAKDYIEKIGDASLLAKIEQRKEEVNYLLNTSEQLSREILQKPFEQIDLTLVYKNLHKILNGYEEFPQQVERAKELLSKIQETYLHKKIAYLELQYKIMNATKEKNAMLMAEMQAKQNKIQELELQLQNHENEEMKEEDFFFHEEQPVIEKPLISQKMASWIPVEEKFYQEWQKNHPKENDEAFYAEEKQNTVVLKGILEPYNRPIKNKPGDYLLVNPVNNLPIAYLYSTQVDLQTLVDEEVVLQGIERPNNNFDYPAYAIIQGNIASNY